LFKKYIYFFKLQMNLVFQMTNLRDDLNYF
jgi:hypothetical protein